MERLTENKLIDWFKNKIRRKVNKVKSGSIRSGRFYAFYYDSKLHEEGKLPYYDGSPLILCLGENNTNVLGLNFHYVPKARREKVIKRLQNAYKKQWSSDDILPNITCRRIALELKHAPFMVKLYIKGRIRKPVTVTNTEMEKAIKIPNENFIGISSKKLWKSLGL